MSARNANWGTVPAVVALALGLGAAAACSSDQAGAPTAPSPGTLTSGGGAAPVQPPPTAEGPGLNAPGIRLAAVPRGDGSFDITEEVMLRGETSTIHLQLPRSGEGLTGIMRKTTPVATSLRIIADDDPVPLENPQLTGARDVPLLSAATRLKLTYRLTGSSVRSLQSETGRASAAIRPLTADVDSTLPTNLVVSGGGLLNAVCPELPETRCAVGEPPGLGIQQGIPAGRALAVLQLNLPMQP
ncbi:hypothetical protein GCM10009789_49620 [Kribbella sancticallisti]|uniref:Lipoprotein n=1 Tax=Kribbella sancticallisti TaxID=460087 RepID=A0ABN2DYW1_9ACTN